MPGKKKRKGKGKGKGKKKGKKKALKLDPEEIRKAFKVFARDYTNKCAMYNVVPFDSIGKRLRRLANAENDPVSPSFDLSINTKCSQLQLRAITETLDKYVKSNEKINPEVSSLRKTYRALSFYRSGLGTTGARDLAEFVGPNNHLKVLELLDCDIDEEGADILGRALSGNRELKELYLDYNALGERGMVKLASGIQWNIHIEILSLKYCGIGEVGGKCIGEMVLVNCKGLRELHLQGNPLGSLGVISIGENLGKAESLKTLNLSDTSFGKDMDAMEALVGGLTDKKGLGPNKHLESLNIDLNTIGNECGTYLKTAIEDHMIITKIKLYPFQEIDTEIYKGIQDTIRDNIVKEKKRGKGKKRKRKKKN